MLTRARPWWMPTNPSLPQAFFANGGGGGFLPSWWPCNRR
jgi:hypothetical protein